MSQIIFDGIEKLDVLLDDLDVKKFLLVCDASFPFLSVKDDIENSSISYVKFDGFSSNPLHSDADRGREIFSAENCDAIVAVGGGSSMDVAKCIKLDSLSSVPLIAIPTTAGTGSESTRHIVVYKDGKKESLSNESVIPNFVIFEPKVLKTLPEYQKKCTLIDAFSQGIESWWSINANKISEEYSESAVSLIGEYMDAYIEKNDESATAAIMKAANFSGRAINITQTTAAHAMSYKLTSLYRLPHGHAVGLCLPEVWKKMHEKKDGNLEKIFIKIAQAMKCASVDEAIIKYRNILEKFGLNRPISENYENDIKTLAQSVNPVRLKNNPVQFTEQELESMYRKIVVKK